MTTFSTLSRDRSREKPSSFEEFYQEWYPRALSLARRKGAIDPEATAQELMMVFFTTDYIDRYDPTREGAVTFDSWINAILHRRLASVYRSQKRGTTIEPMETLPEEEFIHPEVPEFKSAARSVFQMLKTRYGMDQARLWVSVVKQVSEQTYSISGKVRQYELARHLRWTETKVRDELSTLRGVLKEDEDVREALIGYRA